MDKDTRYAKCKYIEMHLEALHKRKENIFILMFVNIKIMDDNLDSIVVTVQKIIFLTLEGVASAD